jgi:hypothetical protein
MVERYDFYRIDDGGSRWRGVVGSRQRTRVAKRAKGALSGGVNGSPGKYMQIFALKMD